MGLSKYFSMFAALSILFLIIGVLEGRIFNVVDDYGAIGDGQTDDSQAFMKGWEALCGANEGIPSLIVPPGKTFLVNPVEFEGPCKSNNIIFQILGNMIAPTTTYSGEYWLSFKNVAGLILNGTGQIDGRGSVWWNNNNALDVDNDGSRPTALKIEKCRNMEISGITHLNSPRNHISFDDCNNVAVFNTNISAPGDSLNTDGIDISRSNQLHIYNSFIGTGDDCVAINNGSSNINISQIVCGPGHGISVGSLGGDGVTSTVEGIHVWNCTVNGTENGARIKTWQGGSGYAKNIIFEDINIWAAYNPIIIDQYYCEKGHDCSNKTSAVEISEVQFKRIKGTSASEKAIELRCSQNVPCKNVQVSDVQLVSSDPAKNVSTICYNVVEGTFLSDNPNLTCSKA